MQQAKKFEILLLDAANTIMHKPALWCGFSTVLKAKHIAVDDLELRRKHKILSEVIPFPDQTSEDFYHTFNAELLLSLGIIPDEKLLKALFLECTYLPWQPFADTFSLKTLNIRKAVLSNFNSTLGDKIANMFGRDFFDIIIGSEEQQLSKPDIRFYQRAVQLLDIAPEKILYIGDSLKLDVIPAQSLGIDAWLIDRDKNYLNFNKRMNSLTAVAELIY